jgi:hypothetical protein
LRYFRAELLARGDGWLSNAPGPLWAGPDPKEVANKDRDYRTWWHAFHGEQLFLRNLDVSALEPAQGVALPRKEDVGADATRQAVPGGASQIPASTNEFDAFLCHASEDKKAIVVPFADAMKRAGLKPWLDEGQVTWGDVLIHKIQNGLTRSRFVVVFVSADFLGKGWPEKELETALAMERGGRKVVLPIFLGLTHAEVEGKYPMVASKIYKKVPEYASGKRVSKRIIADMVDELKAFIS